MFKKTRMVGLYILSKLNTHRTRQNYKFLYYYNLLLLITKNKQVSKKIKNKHTKRDIEEVCNVKKKIIVLNMFYKKFLFKKTLQIRSGYIKNFPKQNTNYQKPQYIKNKIILSEVSIKNKKFSEFEYRNISFYTKKTITYEKNRKVKKDKIYLKFSKMYNFLQNIYNLVFQWNKHPKVFIYLLLISKKHKLTLNTIFKPISDKLTKQKKKPLIINHVYKK